MSKEEIVEMLRERVEKGEKMWKNAEALGKKFDTAPGTIIRWYYETHPKEECHGNTALSPEEDEQLALACLAMSHLNLDLTASQIVETCRAIFNVEISPSSAYRFKDRHSDLFSFRKGTILGKKRIGNTLYDEAQLFFESYKSFQLRKNLPALSIVNYDESRIIINNNGKMALRRLVSKTKSKPQQATHVKGTHCGTFLPFVAANGDVLATYFILSVKFQNENEKVTKLVLPSVFSRTRYGTAAPDLFFNETGYLNTEIFRQIIDDFVGKWKNRHPGLHCCLIGDNLKSHKDLGVLRLAVKNNVFLLFLPAGTTHWSQPLDNGLFARLKQEIHLKSQHLMFQQFFTDSVLFSLVDIVLHAAKKAFTFKAIASSFSEMGLYPLDVTKFLQLARLNHDPSIPWEGPTKRDEFLIQEVVAGLQTFLSSVKKSADESATKVQTIEVTVRKNFLYRADELIRESEREKVEKEILLKEKELEKEKKRDERKRKREEEEKKKQEREDLQAEKKAKKVKELEEKEKKKEENSCKGDCGRVCRNGGSWMGCEFCDVFWVCPVCYRSPIMKQTMAKHEKRCQKL